MGRPMRHAVGLMSGTSMDAIDAALIETDGMGHVRPVAGISLAYDPAFRAELRAVMADALAMERPEMTPAIADVERRQTEMHAAVVRQLFEKTQIQPDIIGFHGQTIAHRPERGWTWQIGDGALLARLTGVAVVNDFRSADVAAGGHGAPLVPAYHAALVEPLREVPGLGCRQAVAVLNLGGVGNITWIGPVDGDVIAFDTGPANALIDDWVHEHTGASHDEGGALAARGRVDDAVLAAMLDKPWFDVKPPKSLDRHDFSLDAVRGLSVADGAATLTAFTAATVARAFRHLPEAPARLLVTGGGRHNATLMAMLRDRLGVEVLPVESAGWCGDLMEAEAFAYLAVRSIEGLPLSWPGTTGVPAPQTGGRLNQP